MITSFCYFGPDCGAGDTGPESRLVPGSTPAFNSSLASTASIKANVRNNLFLCFFFCSCHAGIRGPLGVGV